MAKARKDNKGRALRKGESQRTDNTYVYTYTDPFKKRRLNKIAARWPAKAVAQFYFY